MVENMKKKPVQLNIMILCPVILTKFLKIYMLHVVFKWQKIYKIVFEKAFFFILWRFYLFLVLQLKNLPYFKQKNFTSQKIFQKVFQIFQLKNQKKMQMPQNKAKCLF
jgi:hypothetical protein